MSLLTFTRLIQSREKCKIATELLLYENGKYKYKPYAYVRVWGRERVILFYTAIMLSVSMSVHQSVTFWFRSRGYLISTAYWHFLFWYCSTFFATRKFYQVIVHKLLNNEESSIKMNGYFCFCFPVYPPQFWKGVYDKRDRCSQGEQILFF